ncbi:S41 family peptidase [Georgenia subflava]|uniref:Tricorn protease homolog n=1 Tax=Georgenia subflava TaxID=1622177 RepID=A0A6N7EKA8_9MICO|nr:S41 family peptidase [Georgenia subflava]MPV35704.1 tricorn protease [Georgenia subflava]
MSSSAYLRYPHVHDDLVTFVAADDVWLAPSDGGRAWRLTNDRTPVRNPRISPDGTHVAFVSHRDGHPEVMVTDLDGTAPRRLTWWGAKNTLVLGWTADGRVLAASHAGEANVRHLVVKAVGLDGAVERLRYGPASGVAVRGDGAVALATPGSRPPAHWKRYRGGTAPRLWLDRAGDGGWEQLLADEPASLVDPMWLGERLLFVSDRAAAFPDHADEQANLWVWDAPGEGAPRQLTRQGPDEGYVRDASTDGERVVWHSRGDLWVLDDLDGVPRRLEVLLPGGAPATFAARPTKNLDVLVPDRGGDASLVGWRGNVFRLSHREGPARAVAADSATRYREPTLLGHDHAVMVSDAGGADRLEVRSLTGATPPVERAAGRLGRVLHLAGDPAGRRLATVSHDGWVRLVEVADGAVREVHRSRQGEAVSPSFSPDGRYLLWAEPTHSEGALHRLMILDLAADAGEPGALTAGKFHDHSPTFSADGKYVVFLSDRTFDPTYDTHEFAMSFTGSTRPWLMPLAATEPAPFGPSADGWRISTPKDDRQDDDGRPGAGGAEQTPRSPDLDLAGAEERIIPFPVPSGSYRQLRAAKDGVLWIREAGETGTLGSRRAAVTGDPTPDALEHWSFPQRRVTVIHDAVDGYGVSGDGERVVVRHKDAVTVLPSGRKVEDDDPEKVTVDLDRLRFEVDPHAEWQQMFDENARLMHDHFWREDMDGVDFAAVVARWRPLVERLGSHDDLVDLLWETVGELNTSHAYVMAEEPPGDQDRRLGLLGADLSPADGGWRIERVLPGESSEPDARSPLRAAGVDARAGDLVVAVDGVPVDPAHGPLAQLMGAAEKPVELTLRRDGADRRVVVVPLPDEEVLRYQDWVRGRREYVRERSGGRLGYLHVPDMMGYGWAQLHRDLRHAVSADALVADVRYNRGGHTSQLVVARLAARVVGWSSGRHYAEPGTYPEHAPRGPVVLVANENSGSDGDIVNAVAQAMGVGPVVGVRTWGGVVGIDGRFELVDGTKVTQPRYSTWLQGKGWAVENYGVDPDIEVVHSPADFFSDDDPQLDRAIAEALALVEQQGTSTPPELPEPKVRRG